MCFSWKQEVGSVEFVPYKMNGTALKESVGLGVYSFQDNDPYHFLVQEWAKLLHAWLLKLDEIADRLISTTSMGRAVGMRGAD